MRAKSYRPSKITLELRRVGKFARRTTIPLVCHHCNCRHDPVSPFHSSPMDCSDTMASAIPGGADNDRRRTTSAMRISSTRPPPAWWLGGVARQWPRVIDAFVKAAPVRVYDWRIHQHSQPSVEYSIRHRILTAGCAIDSQENRYRTATVATFGCFCCCSSWRIAATSGSHTACIRQSGSTRLRLARANHEALLCVGESAMYTLEVLAKRMSVLPVLALVRSSTVDVLGVDELATTRRLTGQSVVRWQHGATGPVWAAEYARLPVMPQCGKVCMRWASARSCLFGFTHNYLWGSSKTQLVVYTAWEGETN